MNAQDPSLKNLICNKEKMLNFFSLDSISAAASSNSEIISSINKI